MASNISVRLSVDGEQKFKKAMKDAAKSVNDVDSRLKRATAEFKKNGDAQKLMQTRTKTLNEEIKRQTQIVEALEDALHVVVEVVDNHRLNACGTQRHEVVVLLVDAEEHLQNGDDERERKQREKGCQNVE